MTANSQQIQGWLDRLHEGNDDARTQLLNCACERLTRLARKMLRSYPRVHRWEQTDDVVQNASIRLYRSLGDVKPATTVEFFRLAALNIRRELLDLAKHHYGPRGRGANHATIGKTSDNDSKPRILEKADAEDEPARLAAWSEFHAQVEKLPGEEKEIFDLLYYQGLPQADAAQVLNISERTVKRRWQSARLMLHDALGGQLPEE